MTNGDKIRAMNNEELAKLIDNIRNTVPCDYCYYDKRWDDGRCEGVCCEGCLKWLESEAE